ncbi:hypothetical protein TWF173_003010 [Orbilia oligospora]|nr:hypothetical protein TWF173_003010 [Orbilia oligospora]
MNPGPQIWVILIGINYYMPGSARNVVFPDLKGCVEDVNQLERLLDDFFSGQDVSIHRLTASTPDSGKEPTEIQSSWPTYDNIVNAFKKVTRDAKPNDLVYIHYSGHGAQVKTIFGNLKSNGLDEALVPTDICCGGRYLRDVEVAALLDEMLEKGLIVTLILDCCHSGSANRNYSTSDGLVRGITTPDQITLEHDLSTISSEESLAMVRGKYSVDTKRGARVENHWLLETRGYAFLAACNKDEAAMEAIFDGKSQGLLTYNLIKTLRSNQSTDLTYHELFVHVGRGVKERNNSQNVVLGGEGDRIFLSSGQRELIYMVRITNVGNKAGGEPIVYMAAGSAQGIYEGTMVDVWSSSCTQFKPSERLALLEVVAVDDIKSKAELLKWYKTSEDERQLKSGFICRPHNILQRPVYLSPPTRATDERANDSGNELKTTLDTHSIYQLESPDTAFFHIHTHNGNYVILGSGNQQLRNAVSPLPVDTQNSASILARRIIHLTRYYDILELQADEIGISSPWISAYIEKLPFAFPKAPQFFKNLAGEVDVPFSDSYETNVNEEILLRVTNESDENKYIVVMDLDSSWCVEQIFPQKAGVDSELLGPGETLSLPMRLFVPPNTSPGQILDTIKIIATTEPSSFRWLNLPSLDELGHKVISFVSRAASIKLRQNQIEELQELMVAPRLRGLVKIPMSSSWETVKLTVTMAKNQEGTGLLSNKHHLENGVQAGAYNLTTVAGYSAN